MDPRRLRLLLIGGVGAVAAAVAIVLALTLGGGASLAATLRTEGCTLFKPVASGVPIEGQVHIEGLENGALPEGFVYSSDPPTAGPHFGQAAPFNVYDREVPAERYVHNLEHGGIVVLYGPDVPAETVSQIVGWYEQSPNAVLVSPRASLGGEIALAAWVAEDKYAESSSNDDDTAEKVYSTSRGHLAKCTAFSEKAFDAFRDAYRGKGPERIPVDAMVPGA
jgi:hypothetical protein